MPAFDEHSHSPALRAPNNGNTNTAEEQRESAAYGTLPTLSDRGSDRAPGVTRDQAPVVLGGGSSSRGTRHHHAEQRGKSAHDRPVGQGDAQAVRWPKDDETEQTAGTCTEHVNNHLFA